MPVIQVTVHTDSTVRIETRGFVGSACQHASQALETALGVTQSETLTTEFFQTTHQESSFVVPAETPP
jgi:hypothetical protein